MIPGVSDRGPGRSRAGAPKGALRRVTGSGAAVSISTRRAPACAPVPQRFGHRGRAARASRIEIRDRAGDAQHAPRGARREAEAVDGAAEQLRARPASASTMPLEIGVGEAAHSRTPARRRCRSRAAATRSRTAALPALGAAAAASSSAQRHRPHVDVQVDAVEQRAREARLIARELAVVAAAIAHAAAEPAAGARVRRCDELELGREGHVPPRARTRRRAVLEHLAQRLERPPLELGQLVEEEHAAVRERHLARRGGRRHRAGPPRLAEWWGARNGRATRAGSPASATAAVDARHLERLVDVERRQDAGQAPREHRLAGPGAPRRSSACPPAAAISSARFACSWPRTSARSGARPRRCASAPRARAAARAPPRNCAQHAARDPRRAHVERSASAASAAFSRGATSACSRRRARASASASAPRTGRRRPSSASSPISADAATRSARSAPAAASIADRDRQVEPGAGLAQLGGREVHGDASIGKLLARRGDRRPHARRALAHRGLRQPDDVDARQLRADPHLDLDRHAVHADERCGPDSRHGRSPRDRGARLAARLSVRHRSVRAKRRRQDPRRGPAFHS